MRKLCAFVLVLCLVIFPCFVVSADKTDQETISSIKTLQVPEKEIDYANSLLEMKKINKNSLKMIISCYKSFVESQVSNDKTASWDESTTIQKSYLTYDVNNEVNGLILDLSTKNKDSGYIRFMISPNKKEFDLVEFGYDGKYTIYGKTIDEYPILEKDKIVSAGLFDFYIKNENQLFSIDKQNNITKFMDEIKEKTDLQNKCVLESPNKISLYEEKKTLEQIVYVDKNIPNLFKKGYLPVTMSEMDWGAVCAPTCGVNILKYWKECRGVSNLYYLNSVKETFDELKKFMHTDKDSGTGQTEAFYGMKEYLKNRSKTPALGSDFYNGFEWYWFRDNINNGNLVFIAASLKPYNGKYGGHAFSGVGYQICNNGNYIRVGDQWDKSYSHFYKEVYLNYIYSMWYLRWK